MKINTILDRIDSGSIALPEFQRGYVWNRSQVRKLMRSLYRGYPIGSLLMWETQTDPALARGDGDLAPGVVNLLLDGQQRITSLYGIIRGAPPPFFDGDKSRFLGLYFNLETEEFEFYGPVKMRDDPRWIDVTALMNDFEGSFMEHIFGHNMLRENSKLYMKRLNTIENMKERDLHVETVTGADKDVDVVVDIFNEVNSGGTKLSKGDLALAKVCAAWPDARDALKGLLFKWRRAGFSFDLDWLMRCITTVTTGEARFVALDRYTIGDFATGLKQSERHINSILNLVSGRLGLDHDRVLTSRGALPLMVRYLHQRGGRFENHAEQDRLLYWYIHTMLWGRYSSSTESTLDKDLHAIEENTLDRLIDLLRQDRGDLRLYPRDFEDWSRSARFYPLLYMLTRVWHARDWESNIDLTAHLLGKTSGLQLHHIFPKSLLYEYGYSKRQVNQLANFTFLTQNANLQVSNRDPGEYLPYYASKYPGAIESHWIPMDPDLWRIERYLDFLEARRELLAEAANDFLESLRHGVVPEPAITEPILEREPVMISTSIASDEEEELLLDVAEWVMDRGLAEGELLYQLVDEETGELVAILDLAWPDGLQEYLTQPVALLIDEDDDVKATVQQFGYRYFTDAESFRYYVEQEVLELEPVGD